MLLALKLEMEMSNISINGGNINGLQIGNDNKQEGFSQHNNSDSVTVPQVFDAIKSSLPQIDAAADADAAGEIEESIVRPLQTMAELPAEEINKPETMEKAQSLLNQLVPFAPQIAKGLAAFGNAALSALASRNPIIAGVLAVCKLGSE